MCNIKVSVICLTYNHEKYIRDALEGFVKQKTNFQFEVIIHDDASTDDTPNIIKEYEKKYPLIIKPIYQKENQYGKGINVFEEFLLPKACGKYMALCEGDDFWIDENKLQKQYDVMENNINCGICVHDVLVWDEYNNCIGSMPDKRLNINESGIINRNEIIKLLLGDRVYKKYPFQTSCYFVRYMDVAKNSPQVKYDMDLLLMIASAYDFYFINEKMSCYRKNTQGSWSDSYRIANDDKLVESELYCINVHKEFDVYTNYEHHSLVEKDICTRIARIPCYNDEIMKFIMENSINCWKIIRFAGISVGVTYLFNRYFHNLYRFIRKMIMKY